MIHPHYASGEVRRDREVTRSARSSFAVEQVTVGSFVFFDRTQSSANDDDGER
jgi:hypothetical protein